MIVIISVIVTYILLTSAAMKEAQSMNLFEPWDTSTEAEDRIRLIRRVTGVILLGWILIICQIILAITVVVGYLMSAILRIFDLEIF